MIIPPITPTISGLEARGRIDPMTDTGMLAQIESAKALMSAQHLAAVQLIAQTPEGQATHAAGATSIGAIGGALRDAFKPLAGKLALSVNATERFAQARTNGQSNVRGG